VAKELTHRGAELKALGWSNDDVARYSELWDYRQRWGAINLEREDRQFLRKAEAALPKIQTGKPSIKKPIQEKSYYRWLNFYLNEMDKLEKSLDLRDGERGTWPIILEEELRLLDYYQPVLGLPDTLKAKTLNQVREELSKSIFVLDDTKTKKFLFNCNEVIEALKLQEKSNWKSLRESVEIDQQDYPILSKSNVVEFRQKVRTELIPLIVKLLPSLKETEKPCPPDDWSRNEIV
tara:strand:+ start:234 stop:938 length:705 start_codon:yes stop_codon:yes gene_type:complete